VRTLIDSRMLSRLCAAGAEPALAAFRATAAPLGTGLPPLELTPLAFLDALGVQPPPSEAFPLPEVLREEIFEFLCASLFAADETVSGLSKMRMIKTLWDRAYPWLLKANPAAREEIQALDREMRLRTRADYLAWE